MKRIFTKIFIVLMLVVFTTISAFAVVQKDKMEFKGIVTIDGVIQEQTAQTDGTSLCFEGTTADAFQTCFLITDPTADRTVTFGDSSYTAGATNAHSAITSITVTDTTTNVVTDLLVIDHSGGDTTTGFGTGISFKSEDDTGTTTEEHASIDVVITDGTSTTEESDMVFNVMSNGDVSEQFRLVSAEGATTGDYALFTSNTTETNAPITTAIHSIAGVAGASGIGQQIVYQLPDTVGATNEEAVRFTLAYVDATDTSEDADFFWSQRTNGAVAETLRSVANSSTTTGDYLQYLSNTTDTNIVHDVFRLRQANGASTATTGNGLGISFEPEDAGGAEQQGSIDVVLTDATDSSEDADMVFSVQDAGGIVEHTRLDSDGNVLLEGATADGIQTILASEATTADKTITLPDATGTAYLTSGVGNYRPTASQAAATDTLVLSDCGITQLLNRAAGIVITLPAVTDGCWFKFIVATAPTGTTTVVTPGGGASVNIIQGGIATGEDAAGSVVTAADADTITFATNLAIKGDWAEVFSDGINWYVSGMTSVQDGMTTTQAN